MEKILTVIGLLFNVVGSIIVLIPYLITKVNIDDDFIIKSDNKTGNYTQKKHIKARRIGIVGFSLFTVGFILQIIGLMY